MKQYLLSVHNVEGDPVPSPDEQQKMFDAVAMFNAETQATPSVWVFGGGLLPHTAATVVSGRGGQVLMTDGPFIEGKEHIGGFWIFELPDLDAALALAAKASVACAAPVEVRPFQEVPAG
jgi:hypothetical protein